MKKKFLRRFFAIISLCFIFAGVVLIPASADTFFGRFFGSESSVVEQYSWSGSFQEFFDTFGAGTFSIDSSEFSSDLDLTSTQLANIKSSSSVVVSSLSNGSFQFVFGSQTLSSGVLGSSVDFPGSVFCVTLLNVSVPGDPGIVSAVSDSIFEVGSYVVSFVVGNPLCLIGLGLFLVVTALGVGRRLISGV